MGPNEDLRSLEAVLIDLQERVNALDADVRGQLRDSPGIILRVDRIERDVDRLVTLSKWLSTMVAGVVLAEVLRFVAAFGDTP